MDIAAQKNGDFYNYISVGYVLCIYGVNYKFVSEPFYVMLFTATA